MSPLCCEFLTFYSEFVTFSVDNFPVFSFSTFWICHFLFWICHLLFWICHFSFWICHFFCFNKLNLFKNFLWTQEHKEQKNTAASVENSTTITNDEIAKKRVRFAHDCFSQSVVNFSLFKICRHRHSGLFLINCTKQWDAVSRKHAAEPVHGSALMWVKLALLISPVNAHLTIFRLPIGLGFFHESQPS